jgi:hypothetical protein
MLAASIAIGRLIDGGMSAGFYRIAETRTFQAPFVRRHAPVRSRSRRPRDLSAAARSGDNVGCRLKPVSTSRDQVIPSQATLITRRHLLPVERCRRRHASADAAASVRVTRREER